MKVSLKLSRALVEVEDNALSVLSRCVMAHGEAYKVEEGLPVVVRCWEEEPCGGVGLYDIYGLRLDEDGELVAEVTKHIIDGMWCPDDTFDILASDIIVNDIIYLIGELPEPKLGYRQHFMPTEMNNEREY